ncbi:nicotinate-nucleotide adenylyltransferase [Clostridium polynesiense]|uniref:nicotinate-nucleotide adenylyltransferase n=1 Tax=Clostridium polynesiense TaxID=1325933 RepID=UPI0005912EF8|nr:nicotinate-nucleotide adenylyltransferase [Clostridium polynesiense]
MKKIGLLGGTFNPIHNGHLYIASEAKAKFDLEEIIFMPAGNPPHKRSREILSGIMRSEMVKAAVEGYTGFTLCDYEINKKGYSYTFETLQHLNKLYEDVEIYFITGADCLMELSSWRRVEEILELSKFVVFKRPGYNLQELLKQKEKVEKHYNKEIFFLDLLEMDISSTDIRRRIKNSEEYRFFLPDRVYRIIEKLNLYR